MYQLLGRGGSLSAPRHLRIVAQALGDKLGITVLFSGAAGTASTNGQRIIIPSPAAASEEETTVLLGYLCHEAAHLKATEFPVPQMDPHTHLIWNILEDVRIEQVLAGKWPGTRRMIDKLFDVLLDRQAIFPLPAKRKATDNCGVLERAAGTLSLTLRRDVLHQVRLSPLAEGWLTLFRSAVDPGRVRRVMETGRLAVDPKNTTAEVAAAAAEIIAILREPAKSQGKETGRKKPGPKAGLNDATEVVSVTDDAGSSAEKSNGVAVPLSGSVDGSDQSDLPFAGDLVDAMAENLNFDGIINDLMGVPRDRSRGKSAIRPLEKVSRQNPEQVRVRHDDRGVNYGAALSSEMKLVLGALSRRFDSLLEARTYDTVYTSRSGTKLHTPSLARAAVGNMAIFRQLTEGEAINTAISITTDQSSSMNRRTQGATSKVTREGNLPAPQEAASGPTLSYLASLAAMALVEALERNQAAVQLSGFGGYGLRIFKPWDRRARRHGDILPVFADGSTPLAGALSILVPELLMRAEKRKICVIICDGVPNAPEEVHAQLAECLRSGIEPRVVLISEDEAQIARFEMNVVGTLPVAFTVAAVSTKLAEAIFGALSKAL